VDYEE